MNKFLSPTYVAPAVELGERENVTSPISFYTVALIVLLALSTNILIAVGIWCIAHGQFLVVSWHLGANNMVTIACN